MVAFFKQGKPRIDGEAEREAAAALRLRRLTGATEEIRRNGMTGKVDARCVYHRIRYDRLSAIEAFDRLFAGGSSRRELLATRADRLRRERARREAAIARMVGELVGGLPEGKARQVLAAVRGAA